MKSGPPLTRVDDAELADSVRAGAQTMAVPLSPHQVERLVAYVRLIERWNGTYNLTAVRQPRDMIQHHVLDCLAAADALVRRRGAGTGERLLDVGSGAGLPGLVIATVSPEREVLCIDSVGKKAAFLTQAIGLLSLKNASAVHGRVESLIDVEFDVIASRALASLAEFVRLTSRLMAESGDWMAMKAKLAAAELDDVAGTSPEVEHLHVHGLAAERCIVWMRKKRALASSIAETG